MNLDYGYMVKALPEIAKYIPVTLKLTVVSFLIAFPCATVLAVINDRHIPVLSPVAKVWLSLIRSTPIILQIYFIYNVGPYVAAGFLKKIGSSADVYEINNIYYAYLALAVFSTASLSEAIRAGLSSVKKEQYEAAWSVGMNQRETYMRIIFPQAFATALPVICNSVIDLMKATSLAFIMTVTEITGKAKILGGMQLRYFESYLDVFIIYLVIICIVERLLKCLEKRMKFSRR